MSKKPLHIIGVIGVRDRRRTLYNNSEYVFGLLDRHLQLHSLTPADVMIVTGGGRGAETLVIEWCEKHKVPVETVPPNIQGFGAKKAFSVRNSNIVARADELILIWDGYMDNLGECIINAMHMEKIATCYPAI